MAKTTTTRRRTTPRKTDFRSTLDQYGFPMAALAAIGWFAYYEVFVPLRDQVTESVAEMAEANRDTIDILERHGQMLDHLYRESGAPPLPPPRRWEPTTND
jgi:hypothetical protein